MMLREHVSLRSVSPVMRRMDEGSSSGVKYIEVVC